MDYLGTLQDLVERLRVAGDAPALIAVGSDAGALQAQCAAEVPGVAARIVEE